MIVTQLKRSEMKKLSDQVTQSRILDLKSNTYISNHLFISDDPQRQQQQQQPPLDETRSGFALVVNGHSLVFALSERLELLFLAVAEQCTCESRRIERERERESIVRPRKLSKS